MLYKHTLVFISLLYGFLCSVSAAEDNAPQLSLPLACTIGVDCFIQNYVDADTSLRYSDYRCGFLSYDDHRGTDFRPKSMDAIAQGVPVLAAADGKVRATRDEMDDISVRVLGKGAIKNREAGNSVVIVHGDGWESQYAHLKKGSVAVHAGQTVTRGTVLGLVGLSGNTEFPHLHFEIRHQGKAVDPFVGINGGDACALGKQPLWSADTINKIGYIATEVLAAGFTDHSLAADEVAAETQTLPKTASALIFWLTVFGVQTGDMQVIDLFAPDGSMLLHKAIAIDHNMAQYRSFVGLKRHGEVWTTGDYRISYQLLRQQHAEPILTKQWSVRVF